jgi:hypothetical protein
MTRAETVLLGFPLAFVPPVVLASALANTIPAAASWAIAVLGTAALWFALSVRPAIGFTTDALIVESMFARRRVAWSAISSVTFEDVTDSDTDEVLHRLIVVRYRRYPDQPLPDMPTRFGDFREWSRAHFRTVRLPLPFPPQQASDDARRDSRASRLARHRDRMRAIVLRELGARGYDLS